MAFHQQDLCCVKDMEKMDLSSLQIIKAGRLLKWCVFNIYKNIINCTKENFISLKY